MGWWTFLKQDGATVPTPSTGKSSLYVDSTSGEPSYKDDAGTVHTLVGADGTGIQLSGRVATYADLPAGLTSGDAGTAYIVDADDLLYVWDGATWPADGAGMAIQGTPGPANTLTIGTVTTLAAGSAATADITGTAPNQTLDLGIPKGDAGASGGGDMLAAVYDPDGVAEQLVGETAAQTLTHKDLTDATNSFPATLAKDRTTITALTNSAGVVNVDLSLGDYFTLLGMAANVTSLTFSNLPAAGKARTIDITVSQDATGARTFALPASFKAIGSSDTAVQSAASAKTKIVATTLDAGTTWAYSMAKVAA